MKTMRSCAHWTEYSTMPLFSASVGKFPRQAVGDGRLANRACTSACKRRTSNLIKRFYGWAVGYFLSGFSLAKIFRLNLVKIARPDVAKIARR